jgi:hypothetical protein
MELQDTQLNSAVVLKVVLLCVREALLVTIVPWFYLAASHQ